MKPFGRSSGALTLRVLGVAPEVNGHTGLVADDPRIVARLDRGDVAGADLTFLSAVRLDAHAAREAVEKVRRLQLSVPAIGFRCSDHRQPGSNVP